MNDENIDVDADEVIRLLKDELNRLVEDMGEPLEKCKDCPIYRTLSKFAAMIVRTGIFVEAAKMQKLREYFGLGDS